MHADRNHLHHRLLDLGFSHMQISALLSTTTAGFILLAVRICSYPAELVLGTVLLLACALSFWVERAHTLKTTEMIRSHAS